MYECQADPQTCKSLLWAFDSHWVSSAAQIFSSCLAMRGVCRWVGSLHTPCFAPAPILWFYKWCGWAWWVSPTLCPSNRGAWKANSVVRLQLGWGSYKLCKQWAPLGTGGPCTWWRGWSRVLAMASNRRTACLLHESRCVALPSSAHKCLVLQSDKDEPGSTKPCVSVATSPWVSPTAEQELTDGGDPYNIIAFFPPLWSFLKGGFQSSLEALFLLTGQGTAFPPWGVKAKSSTNWARREREERKVDVMWHRPWGSTELLQHTSRSPTWPQSQREAWRGVVDFSTRCCHACIAAAVLNSCSLV